MYAQGFCYFSFASQIRILGIIHEVNKRKENHNKDDHRNVKLLKKRKLLKCKGKDKQMNGKS